MLQLNSSKPATLLFFFAYRVEYLIGFPFHFNKIEVNILFSFLLGQVEREIPRQNTLLTRVGRTSIGEMKRINEHFSLRRPRENKVRLSQKATTTKTTLYSLLYKLK